MKDEISPEVLVQMKMNLFERMGYEIYHPEVRRMHECTSKLKVSVAPRRTTKSYSAAHDVLMDCLLPEKRIWIVGPNYGLAEKEFAVIHKKLVLEREKLNLPKPVVCQTNARAGQLYIKFPWGTIVEGKSADNPNSLLGEAVDVAIYSESGQLPRQIREKYVYPTLNTTGGREIVCTTPEEGAEWVYEQWLLGQEGKDKDIVDSFQWDGHANPLYDWEQFETAKKTYGENHPVFREQFLGEWVFYGGKVYPMFNEEDHVIPPFKIPASWPRIRGLDFGHRDPFVCLWCAVGPQGELYLYREYYKREGVTREHAQFIKEYSKNENVRHTEADPSAKQLIEDLSYEGIKGINSANNDQHAGRMQVSNYLLPTPDGPPPFDPADPQKKRVKERYPRLYVFNTLPETIREFRFYRWKEKPATFREGEKERTEGEDHAMDCARYILMSRPSPFRSIEKPRPGTFMAELKKRTLDRRMGTGIYRKV